MTRPAILIVEPDRARRRELSHGLAERGYEVVPAADAEEGERFLDGLGPAVIVAPADLARFGDGSILDGPTTAGDAAEQTLVLLGEGRDREQQLPGSVAYLDCEGLSSEDIVRRLCLVLIGRDIGVEADSTLESLVGDLSLSPLFDLVRALHRAQISCRIELDRGAIHFDRGEVVAAQAGPGSAPAVRGLKAFCRLGRLDEEPFHVFLGEPPAERQIEEGLNALLNAAVKDSLGAFPDPHARLGIEMGEDLFRTHFDDFQQEILARAHKEFTVQELLDALDATDGAIVRELLRLAERGLVTLRDVEPAVQIVTDSTCDLPQVLAAEHELAIVPLTVQFGDEVFKDRVELPPGAFYKKLEQSRVHPVSNPPEPEEFAEVYRRGLAHGDVVSLHISRKLSLTVERARQAAAAELRAFEEAGSSGSQSRPPAIEVTDSRHVSLSLGMLALFGARMAARGESAKTITRRLRDMRSRLLLYFVVDTLEYLVRGGRIGKASAFLGGLLRIKPILSLIDGEVEPVVRVMGRRAAYPRLVELVCQRIDRSRPIIVAIAHAAAPVWADQLRRLVEGELEVGELFMGEIGPVIGTHVGPGVVGLAAFQPDEEEAALIAPVE